MKKHFKQLGKDTLVYGIGSFIASSLGFFLLPVYTRIFSPEEYGVIEMLTLVSNFFRMTVYMGGAHSFFFMKQKKYGKDAQAVIVSSIFQLKFLWGTVLGILALMVSPIITDMFLKTPVDITWYIVVILGALINEFMNQSVEVLRFLHRPWAYILINFGRSILGAIVVITLVVHFHSGIIGFFWGMLAGSLAMGVWGWWIVREYLTFTRVFHDWWPRLIRFGAPLIPFNLASYIMVSADRWFIVYYHGERAVGIYSIAAKFAGLIALAIATFRKAWFPVAMEVMHQDEGADVYRLVARIYMGVGCLAALSLTFVSPFLLKLMTTEDYHSSYVITSVLSCMWIFHGFHMICSGGILKTEKTYISSILMVIAAMVNVYLNNIMVPIFGAIGAAISTVFVYFVWIFSVLLMSEKLWRVGFPLGVLLLQVLLGGTGIFLQLWLFEHGDRVALAMGAYLLTSVFIIWLSLTKQSIEYLQFLIGKIALPTRKNRLPCKNDQV